MKQTDPRQRVQYAALLRKQGFRLIPTDENKKAVVSKGSYGKELPDATWEAKDFTAREIGTYAARALRSVMTGCSVSTSMVTSKRCRCWPRSSGR